MKIGTNERTVMIKNKLIKVRIELKTQTKRGNIVKDANKKEE